MLAWMVSCLLSWQPCMLNVMREARGFFVQASVVGQGCQPQAAPLGSGSRKAARPHGSASNPMQVSWPPVTRSFKPTILRTFLALHEGSVRVSALVVSA